MNKEIFDLERKISEIVHQDNNRSVHFEYIRSLTNEYGVVTKPSKVNAWTFNNINNESFLLKSEEGNSYSECLFKILNWLENVPKSKDHFTVKWRKMGTEGLNVSYFYCKDVIELVEKFYERKNINEYQIFEIKMNPIS